jgi:methionyl-tRNA formyltransferase
VPNPRKIVLFAGGEVGLAFCRLLMEDRRRSELTLAGILAAGRGNTDRQKLIDFANENDVPVLRNPLEIKSIPDLWMGFSAGNSIILEQDILAGPRHGFINFHAAPLPRFRGSAAPAFAIMEDHREFGVTFHKLVEELDAGPIIATRTFEICDVSTSKEVDAQCISVGITCFEEMLSDFMKLNFSEQPNCPDRPPYRRGDMEKYRKVDLNWPIDRVWKHVRACDWNGVLKPAFAEVGSRRIFLTAHHRGKWI